MTCSTWPLVSYRRP